MRTHKIETNVRKASSGKRRITWEKSEVILTRDDLFNILTKNVREQVKAESKEKETN